jgi:hypothetical protein
VYVLLFSTTLFEDADWSKMVIVHERLCIACSPPIIATLKSPEMKSVTTRLHPLARYDHPRNYLNEVLELEIVFPDEKVFEENG